METTQLKTHLGFSFIFNPSVLNPLLKESNIYRLLAVLDEFQILNNYNLNLTLKELFEYSYNELLKNYRNEYVFKNAVAEKILLGRHSINSSSIYTEFRVNTSKADVVIFNGTSHAYEIKTDLDNLDRLESQIENYQKAFEYVNVVSVPSKIDSILEAVDDSIGILVLTERYTLKTYRKAQSNIHNLEHDAVFDILRKDEYTNIVKSLNGKIPDVPNTKIYSECKQIFQTLNIKDIHKQTVNLIKQRNNHKKIASEIKKIPSPLKIAILESKISGEQINSFLSLLDQKICRLLH